MKNFKERLTYLWKHREAILFLIIAFLILFFGLVILDKVINDAL